MQLRGSENEASAANIGAMYSIRFPDFEFSRRSSKKATAESVQRFRALVREAVPNHGLKDPIGLRIRFWTPMDRSWDLDNLVKPLLDAMTGWLYKDDSQIVALHAFLHSSKMNPRIEVVVLAGGDLWEWAFRQMKEDISKEEVRSIIDKLLERA